MPSTAEGKRPVLHPRVNSHIHLPPNFTAFETTTQAVALADAQDVRVLGVSNYYDYAVYAEFAAQACRRGIYPLFGIEIICLIDSLMEAGIKVNDPANPGKMYLCGKGITQFDPMPQAAQELLQTIRDNDSARMAVLTDKLAAVFAESGLTTGLDAEAVKARIVARHGSSYETVYLQERHVAQAFQEILFDEMKAGDRAAVCERAFGVTPKSQSGDAVALQNEIRSQLLKAGKPAYVAETFVDFDHAYRLILALGGIPCYPTLADGTTPITHYEQTVEDLISDLKARRIPSAEFIPIRNAPEVLSHYVTAMRQAGLFVTAGTEHNTRDLLPLEPTCLGGAPIPDDLQEIFWEGACVIAAHQHLRQTKQPGFVDDAGTPNPHYPTDHERIEAFRRLGEQVITQYREGSGNGHRL